MSLREEELESLFKVMEAIAERSNEPIFSERGDQLDEKIDRLKQSCINLIAFGEPPEE